jgi:hypothetical protein
MPTPTQLAEWHDTFSRIERVDDYQKLNGHFKMVCTQITLLEEEVQSFRPPRNPREDAGQLHDKTKLQMMKKQKQRLEAKLLELSKQIEADILEESKKVT